MLLEIRTLDRAAKQYDSWLLELKNRFDFFIESNRIQNHSQQISGRNNTPQKETYAEVPTGDDNVLTRFDQDITNDSFTPKIKASNRIKSAIKRIIDQDKYQFNQAWDQLKEDIPLELENYKKSQAQQTIARAMKSNLSRNKMSKLINENKPTLSSYFNSYPNAMKLNVMDVKV